MGAGLDSSCPGIHLFDLEVVAFFDGTAPQLQCWGECAGLWREFIGDKQDSFHGLKASQVAVDFGNNPFIKCAHSRIGNQFLAGGKRHLVGASPVLQ